MLVVRPLAMFIVNLSGKFLRHVVASVGVVGDRSCSEKAKKPRAFSCKREAALDTERTKLWLTRFCGQ